MKIILDVIYNFMNISTYKKVLSKYATGITIVTKKNKNDFITGITVNSFVSISLKPAYISWSLDKTTTSFKKFNNLKFFNIYILSSKQTNVSNYFSSKNEIKKKSVIVRNLFKYNLAELNCKTIKKINIGDHLFFIGKVLNVKLKKEKKPLIYFASKYKKLS
ncbi:MAG: flavin reductase [Proteobacteria bacterium]|nr:flavin reductase [Candidatus Fonsibacter sp. PEL5]NKA16390.1 flavin reductase [Candidatus Fonsibacter sp. PEL55]